MIALATTPSETSPSVRAWYPSATRAGLSSRFPRAKPDQRCDLIADEPDRSGGGQRTEVGEWLRIDQAPDRLH